MRRFAPLLLAVAAAAGIVWSGLASGDKPPAPQTGTTVIRNVRVFDGDKVLADTTVVFDRSGIVAIGKDAKAPEGAQVIDGRGKTLLPGLIDAHTHNFGESLTRALQFGVTTQLDMFTNVQLLQAAKREQKAGTATARADLYSAGTLVTVKGGHGTEYFPIPTFTPGGDAQAFVDARIAEGSDFIKLVYDDGSAFHIHFETLTPADLAALIRAAHARKKLAVVHISSLEGARVALNAGADGLVHLFGDRAADDALIALARQRGAFVIPTLTVIESTSGVGSGTSLTTEAHLAPYLTAEEKANLRASFGGKFANHDALVHASDAVRRLRDAGVPLLAGTDAPNPGTAHGASMHRELELLVAAGLTPADALHAATAVPADIFGLGDRGRIRKSLRADLVLVDGDPTTMIADTRAINTIWKSGVQVARTTAAAAAAKPQPPAADKLASGVISSFDAGLTPEFGTGWSASTDQMMGGTSTVTFDVASGGANGTKGALHIITETTAVSPYPWAGVMFAPGAKPMAATDLSSKSGITFLARGDGVMRVMVLATSAGRVPRVARVPLSSEWKPATVTWKDLELDGSDIQAVIFCGDAGKREYWIDEVAMK